MTVVDFLQQNASALIGLIGVALGAVLVGLLSLLTQSLQRKSAVNLQRIEWKRSRREAQLDSLISWINQWLRSAAQVRRAENTIHSVVPDDKHMRRIAFMEMDKINEEQTSLLGDLTATSAPVVYMIGDERLINLYERFKTLISGFQEALNADDVDAAIESNKAIVQQARNLAADIQLRADELIDKTFDA